MPIQTNARNSNNVFISINPDLGKHVGHYLGHERAINSVIKDRGDMHIVLCNKDVSDYIDCDFLLIPTFSCEHSARLKSDCFENDFKTELLFSLFKVFNGIAPKNDCNIIVYMYLGSIKVASWICQLLSEIPSQLTARLQIHINCFNNIVDPNFQEIERDINIIKDSLAKGHIHLSIDTEYAKQNLLNRNGNEIGFRIWPMIATTDYSSLFNRSQYETSHVNNRKYSVFFPGTSQIEKGVSLSSELCLKLSHENPSKYYAIRRSNHKIDANTVETFQKLETRDNVHIVDSVNSCVEYLETFLNSEVSCITYDPAVFAFKTSAVLLDSIVSGCKVVCCKKTWLGQKLLSSKLNAYALSQNHSVDSYYAAIYEAKTKKHHTQKLISDFLSEYSATRLYYFLIRGNEQRA